MIYSARVVRIGGVVEEEVLLRVLGYELLCFLAASSDAVEVGCSYLIEFDLVIFDEFSVVEVDDGSVASIEPVGDGFSYLITGRLNDGKLAAGKLVFEDDALRDSFSYLNGKMISLRVDRLDVIFP
jgi:hypothetical protein